MTNDSLSRISKIRDALECAGIFAIKNAGQRSAGKLLAILKAARVELIAMGAACSDTDQSRGLMPSSTVPAQLTKTADSVSAGNLTNDMGNAVDDKQAQECRDCLCTGCNQQANVRVHFIGDIMICPNCIHLLVSIVENEAPEAVTWLARTPSTGVDKEAVIKAIEKLELEKTSIDCNKWCHPTLYKVVKVIRQLPDREPVKDGVCLSGDSSLKGTAKSIPCESEAPANSCEIPDVTKEDLMNILIREFKSLQLEDSDEWFSQDYAIEAVRILKPYLATREPIKDERYKRGFDDGYDAATREPVIVSLDKCAEAIIILTAYDTTHCEEISKAVLDSLKAQGVEMKYHD